MTDAQAIYLRTGEMQVALAEFTTDADVAVDPDLLGADPLIESAMRAAGFTPDPRNSAVGSWISLRGVCVPPHDSKAMREELVGDPVAVAESVALLAQDLLDAVAHELHKEGEPPESRVSSGSPD